MNIKSYISCMLLCMLTFTACTVTDRRTADGGSDISMRHAELLTMKEHDGYITAQIRNPWDSTRTLHTYILMPRNGELPADLPEGDVVRTPISNAVVYSSVHCSLINELGAYSSIRGVCDLPYIYLQNIHRDVKAGRIADLGESMAPNIEGIIDLKPDAILLSPFENSGGYGKLGKLGIPLIECADYMETSPLGRTEWMRFFGLLLGRQHEADSIFTATEARYNDIKRTVAETKNRPTVVTEMKTGSTWYIAGGNSTVAKLISDAGGSYIFSNVKGSGAVPYSPEAAYEKAKDAQCWLIKYGQATPMTPRDLKAAWTMNAHMAAYESGNVYGCNLSNSSFYEETPFHPELLLGEYATILHPELMHKKLKYYHRILSAK